MDLDTLAAQFGGSSGNLDALANQMGGKSYIPEGPLKTAGNAATDAMTLGLAQPAYSALAALANKGRDLVTGDNQDKSFGNYYDDILGNIKGQENASKQAHPVANALGTIAGIGGSLGDAAVSGGKAILGAAKQGIGSGLKEFGIQSLKSGLTTAPITGVNALAYADGPVQNRIDQGIKGAEQGFGIGLATPLVGKTINAVGSKFLPVVEKVAAADLRSNANQLYKVANETGGVLKPEVTNNFLDKIQEITPQSELGRLVSGDSPLSKLSENLQSYRNKPITLADAQDFDQVLGKMVNNLSDKTTGRLTADAKDIYDVQTAFRKQIENAAEDHVVGGKEGFDALKAARAEWSKSVRLGDVERILSKAELADNPGLAIKNGFKSLLNNPSRIKGFSTEERQAIKKAATTGIAGDLLRSAASRLTGIITTATGAGGLAGSAVSNAGSIAARGALKNLQTNKANKVAELIANGPQAQLAIQNPIGANAILGSQLYNLRNK